VMPKKQKKRKSPKRVLRLPDLAAGQNRSTKWPRVRECSAIL